MDEYIEREALIEWLKCIPLIDLSDWHGPCRVIMEDDFKKAIKKMPKGIIADVAPVRHGRWICIRKGYGEYECSVCHGVDSDCSDYYGTHVVTEQDYCPNCGCRMDGGDGE